VFSLEESQLEEEPICKVDTWPLTYDDGINSRQKNCDDSEKSYYICRVKGKSENWVIISVNILTELFYLIKLLLLNF